MFVWFEGVNYGRDADEKSDYGDGDNNIGNVKYDNDNYNDDDDAGDNDDNDYDNDDDHVIVKAR